MTRRFITLTVNGEARELSVSAQQSLLDVIRGALGLTGTKEGCTTGSCGVCTVLNGRGEAILSCLTPALEWDGEAITTIEGLEAAGQLAPIQQAFIAHHAVQCGFCTPGVILSAQAVLNDNPAPGEEEINDGLAGVLCRCTGHIKVREAVRDVGRFRHGATGIAAGAAPAAAPAAAPDSAPPGEA